MSIDDAATMDAVVPILIHEAEKAGSGSRTHNPRITNAVLCQLKLRWPDGDGKTLSECGNPATLSSAQ